MRLLSRIWPFSRFLRMEASFRLLTILYNQEVKSRQDLKEQNEALVAELQEVKGVLGKYRKQEERVFRGVLASPEFDALSSQVFQKISHYVANTQSFVFLPENYLTYTPRVERLRCPKLLPAPASSVTRVQIETITVRLGVCPKAPVELVAKEMAKKVERAILERWKEQTIHKLVDPPM